MTLVNNKLFFFSSLSLLIFISSANSQPHDSIDDQPIFNMFVSCAPSPQFHQENELRKGIDIQASYDSHTIGQLQSLLRQNLRSRAVFDRNLTSFSQFNRSSWGNGSCLSTSFGVILEYWNRTRFPSIMGGRDLPDTIERMRNLSGTRSNGIDIWNFTIGVTRFLNETGYARNFTFKVFVMDTNQNDSTVLGARVIRGLNVTYIVDNNISFADIVREVSTETVILILDFPGVGFHAVALSDYNTAPNPDGTYTISIMDPRLGSIVNVRVDETFGTILTYPTGENAGLTGMISFSPQT